jgi:phosphonate transport system substrate-binding protein
MGLRQLIIPAAIIVILLIARPGFAQEEIFTFGVLNQRNPVLTAQYWNPIMAYISRKSGVSLRMQMGKTVQETDSLTVRGGFDFVYSNHIFMPVMLKAGYRVIARPEEESIRGQIVVLESSSISELRGLDGKEVAFPSETAFVAYAVTMDALQKSGVHVKPVFAGNQEGVMGQLKTGKVPAASVNSKVMLEFSRREKVLYRSLWSSEEYAPIPIAVHQRVDRASAHAVQEALINMARDPEGITVLQTSAAIVKQNPPFGFVRADDSQYENQRSFYRSSQQKSR